MTKTDAVRLLALLTAAFPTAAATKPTLELYLATLQALPLRRGEQAIETLIQTHAYPTLPALAELIAASGINLRGDDPVSQRRRQQFADAKRRGVELVDDLGSETGYALAGEEAIPLQAVAPIAALPSGGSAISDEERAEMRRRMSNLARKASA